MMLSAMNKTLPSAISKTLPPGTRMIRTKDLVNSFACNICFKIHRNAISISECIHTFCKRCILQKVLEEDLRCCPVCATDLGGNPIVKLKRDHQLRSLASNIFHSIKKNIKEEPNVPEEEAKETEIVHVEDDEPEMPSIPMPARRKARSLSSFVTSPTVTCGTVPAGRRKHVPKKFPSFISNEDPLREVEDRPERPSSPFARKTPRIRKQRNPSQRSKQQVSSRKDAEQRKPINHAWDLNCLAEAVDDTMMDSKPRSQGIVIKTPPSTVSKDKPNFSKAGKGKQCVNTSNIIIIDDDEEEEDHKTPPPAPPVPKPRGRPRGSRQKKTVAAAPSSEGVRISPQAVVDVTASERRITSVWLQLVATNKRNAGPPLRQIPTNFLWIKDIGKTVLFIKKYIVQKLGLESVDEVEIEIRTGLVPPDDMPLYSVLNLWGQLVAPPEKVLITMGSSAKDFVMALKYSRKA